MENSTEIEKLIDRNDKFRLKNIFKSFNNDHQIFQKLCLKHINNSNNLNSYLIVYCMLNNFSDKLDELLDSIGPNLQFSSKFFYYIVRENNHENLKALIKYAKSKQDLNKIGDYLHIDKNESILIRAIKNQNLDIIKLVLNELGASVSQENNHQQSPLYIAAGLNDHRITEYLISKNALVDSISSNGDTPLIRACQERKLDNVRILIENGADINHQGFSNNTPLMTTITDDVYHDNDDYPSNLVFMYLMSKNVDLTLKNTKGSTAFVRACGSVNFKMVKIIHENLLKLNNSEYVEQEIYNGFLNAFYFLRIDTIEYLIKYLVSKRIVCDKIEELFSVEKNQYLGQLAKIFDYEKKASILDTLINMLIRYGYFTNNGLFYIQRYISIMNNFETRQLIETEFYEDYKIKFLTGLEKLINKLIFNGKINLSKINNSAILNFMDFFENENCLNLHIEVNNLINKMKSDANKPLPLSFLSRNTIKDNILSLTDNHLNQLQIPKHLKIFLLT